MIQMDMEMEQIYLIRNYKIKNVGMRCGLVLNNLSQLRELKHYC